jgi:hypothetical protein
MERFTGASRRPSTARTRMGRASLAVDPDDATRRAVASHSRSRPRSTRRSRVPKTHLLPDGRAPVVRDGRMKERDAVGGRTGRARFRPDRVDPAVWGGGRVVVGSLRRRLIVSSASTRVLIVAYRAAATPLLLAEVRERAGRSACSFTLLVPRPYWDPDTEEAVATLELAIPLLEEAVGGHVEGIVGDTDPFVAVRDAVERGSGSTRSSSRRSPPECRTGCAATCPAGSGNLAFP